MNFVRAVGRYTLDSISSFGASVLFLTQIVTALSAMVKYFSLVVRQVYAVGVLSLLIILVSGLFVGMVLGLQGYNTLVDFGAEESLGVVVALSLVRELGPVVSALLFAGRAGSAMTAEIGLMKATEQLSSLEMMAVDPIKYVMVPRFVASMLSLPLLAAIFSAVGIMGGYLVGVSLLGVDAGAYWSQIHTGVDLYQDIFNGVVKSIAFALIAVWVALYVGYACKPTSEGVAKATTTTVVITSLAVLGADFLLTAMMF